MTRFLRNSVFADMLALWAFETLACFVALYAILTRLNIGTPVFSLFPAINAAAIDNAMVLSLLLGMLCFVLGLYTPTLFERTRTLLATACIAAIASVPVVWAASTAGVIDGWAILGSKWAWLTELTLVWLALLVSTRLIYCAAHRSRALMHDAFAAGQEPAVQSVTRAIARFQQRTFGIAGDDVVLNGMSVDVMMPRLLLDEAPVASSGRNGVAHAAFVSDAIGLHEVELGRVDLAMLTRSPADILRIHGKAAVAPAASAARRVLDIGSAIFLLILTLPVTALTALAIVVDSPGPLIYRQERVGLGGKLFTILKFRSMSVDAERFGAMFAQQNDPRVTRVGRIIRLVRVDELPQLVNVLRGEMSMVGPRPERPGFVERYEQTIPFYALRTLVKPGVTGWAQVKAPYSANDEATRDKLSFDLYYLKNRNLQLDLKIMLATVRVILFKIGAR